MKSYLSALAGLVAVSCGLATTHAAFIVEPRSGGKAFANFSTGGDTGNVSASTASGTAAGLTADVGSVFGGTSASMDQYIYSYTPGVDLDNTVYTPGQDLGAGNSATGLVGGVSGVYRVYATWPVTGNISHPDNDPAGTPTNYVASSDGADPMVDLFQDSDAGGLGDVWNLIGVVQLTAGQTYTVTQTAPNSLFVSMRSAGVMWELIPEPSSLALAGLALIGLGMRRR